MIAAEADAHPSHRFTLSVLLIEDDASDAWLLQNTLKEIGSENYVVRCASNVESAITLLQDAKFGVALLDLSLPGISGVSALLHLQVAAPTLPIIILTSLDDEKTALSAVKRGAQDYLIKGQEDAYQIKRAMRYSIERKHFEESLIQRANYDMLTGLINRPFFENRLKLAMARSKRNGVLVGVLFLDLNGFKRINDSFGHETGDHLLKKVAARLASVFREYDTIARFGGDEFAILLEGISVAEDCAIAAQKIIDAFAMPIDLEERALIVNVSVGIAMALPKEYIVPSQLIKRADIAMYRAKENHGGSYCFYDASMQPPVKATA